VYILVYESISSQWELNSTALFDTFHSQTKTFYFSRMEAVDHTKSQSLQSVVKIAKGSNVIPLLFPEVIPSLQNHSSGKLFEHHAGH
jgi:hypothetical protein